MKPSEAIKYLKDNEAKFLDVRFTDLFGAWHHFSFPARAVSADTFENGVMFDGSSIRGFQTINESDMLLMLDTSTLFMDPFAAHDTAVIIADVRDPFTMEEYSRDPRNVALKAEKYLVSTGIADTCYFGPEAEFFVFDKMAFRNDPHAAGFEIDSVEAHWNSNAEDALGYTMRNKGGYFPCAPSDKLNDLRAEMCLVLDEIGVDTEIHHHEVAAAGQCEIDVRFDSLRVMADKQQKYKYVVKNVAAAAGYTVTFMPKPLYGDNGSGMHCHQSLWKNGTNIFYDEKGYAGL